MGKITFGEVDCDDESLKPICYAFGVTSTPTFVLIKDSRSYKFDGGPNAERVKAFIEQDYQNVEGKKLPKKREGVEYFKKRVELVLLGYDS